MHKETIYTVQRHQHVRTDLWSTLHFRLSTHCVQDYDASLNKKSTALNFEHNP